MGIVSGRGPFPAPVARKILPHCTVRSMHRGPLLIFVRAAQTPSSISSLTLVDLRSATLDKPPKTTYLRLGVRMRAYSILDVVLMIANSTEGSQRIE